MRYIQPLQPAQNVTQKSVKHTAHVQQSFQQVLEEQQSLKVSKHASQRLEQRHIQFDSIEWNKITSKVLEAKQKGVNEPLVVTPKAAMIVSAKNMTVITAMSRTEANEQLFTNIDGTILLS